MTISLHKPNLVAFPNHLVLLTMHGPAYKMRYVQSLDYELEYLIVFSSVLLHIFLNVMLSRTFHATKTSFHKTEVPPKNTFRYLNI